MSADSESLVLGTAYRLTVDDVWIFVESLRRFYSGNVMLLVNSYQPPELATYLRSRDVFPVHFDGPPWMTAHVQMMRYVRYGEVLRDSRCSYDRILLTDVSDVVFQGHPFDSMGQGELLCFMEHPGCTIAQSKNMVRWIQQIYGDEALAELGECGISCSGTTIGTHPAIIRYIDLLLSQADPGVLAPLSGYRGHDQGMHNYLLHKGYLPEARLVPNGEHVYTLGLVPGAEVFAGEAGTLLTPDGRACPIVHQYTYNDRMRAHVAAAYPRSG